MSGVRTVHLKKIGLYGSVSEREEVHKKAFTKWINSHLSKAYPPVRINDIIKDLSNGSNWLNLFEVLLEKRIDKSSGHSHLHNLSNLQKTLDICKENQIKLDGINAKDISEGNSKTILGLLWNIILHFQMKGTLKTDAKAYSIEKTLQTWCQQRFEGYKDVKVTDFSSSWRDGKGFNAILHSYRPDLFDFSEVMKSDSYSRLDHAFTMASLEWNVPRLLEPSDVDVDKPDKKMITMYLTCLFERLESRDKSPKPVTTTEATKTPHFVTSANTDAGSITQATAKTSKAFFLSRKRSSEKSDKSSDESETTDFPRVFIEEKRTIQVGSVSSDVSKSSKSSRSSSSSSTDPLHALPSPTGSGKESQSEDFITTTTTTDVETFPELDLSEPRVKLKEMYRLSSISDEDQFESNSQDITDTFQPTETSSPFSTDSEATSTETVIHVPDNSEKSNVGPWQKREFTRKGQSQRSTVTTVTENQPGGSVTTITRATYTIEGPATQTRTSTRTIRQVMELTDTEGSREQDTREESRVETRVTRESTEIGEIAMESSGVEARDIKEISFVGESHGENTITKGAVAERREIPDIYVSSIHDTREESCNETSEFTDVTGIEESNIQSANETSYVETHKEAREKTPIDSSYQSDKTLGEVTTSYTTVTRETSLVEMPDNIPKTTITESITTRYGARESESDFDKISMACDTAFEEAESSILEKSMQRRNELFEENLYELETAVTDLEKRIREADLEVAQLEVLIQRCTSLESKIEGVVTRGRTMITNQQLHDSKEQNYVHRMEELESRITILISTATEKHERASRARNQEILDEKLTQIEADIFEMEPRIRSRDSPVDVKTVIKERDQLEVRVNQTLKLGRAMISEKVFDKEQSENYQTRMNQIERQMTFLKLWPVRDLRSITNYDKLLDDKLKVVESTMSHLEPHLKYSFTVSDIEPFVKEQEHFQLKTEVIIQVGRDLINDKAIDQDKETHFTQRINQLEKKARLLTMLPIREINRISNYEKYISKKLDEIEKDVSKLEPKITNEKSDFEYLEKERDALKDKVDVVLYVGRSFVEHGSLDKKAEKALANRMDEFEKKTALLWIWPLIHSESPFKSNEEYLENLLQETRLDFADIENKLKKSITSTDITIIFKQRNEVKQKFYTFVKLLQEMINNELLDKVTSKELLGEVLQLEKQAKIIMTWPLKELTSVSNHNKYLLEKLDDHEQAVGNMESEIKMAAVSNKDAMGLIKDRDNLDTKVQCLTTLGHEIIAQKLIDKTKSHDFTQRLDQLEKRMKILVMWPVIGADRIYNKEEFLVENLNAIESAVSEFEPKIKEENLAESQVEVLSKEREELEIKINGVVGFGRSLVEDKLFSQMAEKDYTTRLDELEKRMRLFMLWPLKANQRSTNYNKILKDKLFEMESGTSELENRIRWSIHQKDNKDLIKERDNLNHNVHDIVCLGRDIVDQRLVDQNKAADYLKRMDHLEEKMKLLMGRPILEQTSTLFSSRDREKFLDSELSKADKMVDDVKFKIKQRNLSEATIKSLIKEREDVEPRVHGVIQLGRTMIEDNLIDKKKEKVYHTKFQDLEKKHKQLMNWPIMYKPSVQDYSAYYETKLKDAEIVVDKTKSHLDKVIGSKKEKYLVKHREEVDVKVSSVITLGRDMIAEKLFEEEQEEHFRKRINELDKEMTLLMMRPIITDELTYDAFYGEKLKEIESGVRQLSSRLRKTTSSSEKKELAKERTQVEIKVNAVTSLGREMIEDKLFATSKEKEYKGRIKKLQVAMRAMMLQPLEISEKDCKNYLKDKLVEVEKSVDILTDKIKGNTTEYESLITERDDLSIQVGAVCSFGRGLIEDETFDTKTERDFEKRIDNVEKRMKFLIKLPIGSNVDYAKYYNERLTQTEEDVGTLQSRLRNAGNVEMKKSLLKQRDDLESKVRSVSNLGHYMIEDNFFDDNTKDEYKHRISNLQNAMEDLVLVEDLPQLSSVPEQSAFDEDRQLSDQLTMTENEMSAIEPRVWKAIHNRDNKKLIKERDYLHYKVLNVLNIGRKTIDEKLVDESKINDYRKRMDNLDRKMRFLMGWPILEHISAIMELPLIEKASTRLSVHDRVRFLDNQLEETEKDLASFQRRVKQKELSEDEAQSLKLERKHLEPSVAGVVGLGRGMISDNLVDKNRESEYNKRFKHLERTMEQLMLWPIMERPSDEDYDKYFEFKLVDAEYAVRALEMTRIEKSAKSVENKDEKTDYKNEKHELQTKVYSVIRLGCEMIEHRFFSQEKEKDYKQRLHDLEKEAHRLSLLLDNEKNREMLFVTKLQEAEESLKDFIKRNKQGEITTETVENMSKQRDQLSENIEELNILYKELLEDKLVEDKKIAEYQTRVETLNKEHERLKEWPYNQNPLSIADQVKDFEEKLVEVEETYKSIEPRVKKSIHNKDNKALIQERNALNNASVNVINIGRQVIEDQKIDKEQSGRYQTKLDDLENRMKLLMGWPVIEETSVLFGLPIIEQASTRLNVHDRVRFLNHKLEDAEKGCDHLLSLLKSQKNLTTDDAEYFKAEREVLEPKVFGVLGLGQVMLKDSLIDKNRHKEYSTRFKELERKLKEMMLWPIIIKSSEIDYDNYYEVKLLDVESSVDALQQRIKKPIHSAQNQRALNKQRVDTETKVYAVVSLGRAMIEDKYFNTEKQNDFEQRITVIERKMTMIMLWPLVLQDSGEDYIKYFENKLSEAEESVKALGQRFSKEPENKVLSKDRRAIDKQVQAVTSLGRAMVEEKYFDKEKEDDFTNRMTKLERAMKLLMLRPIGSSIDYDRYFEYRLTEVESDVESLEPRIKTAVFNTPNQQALMKERASVDVEVYAIGWLGRDMMKNELFVKNKEKDFQHRIDRLERTMRLLMLWPIGKLNSIDDRNTFLEDNLQEIEKAVSDFQLRAEQEDMAEDNIKEMEKERDQLTSKADDIVSLGRDMVNSKLVNGSKTQEYTARFDDLDEKVKTLKSWPNKDGLMSPSDKDFDDALREMESAVNGMEPRVKNAIHNKENKTLIRDRDILNQNLEGVLKRGREMIQDKLFDKDKASDYQKRMNDLEKRMIFLMGWPILEYMSPLVGIPILEQTGELFNLDGREKFLEEKLQQAEEAISYLQVKFREKQPSSEEMKNLTKERDYVEPKVLGVVGLGRGMIEDGLVHKNKEESYTKRINDLEEKMTLLKCWSFGYLYESHDMFFEERLRGIEDKLWTFEDRIDDEDLEENEVETLRSTLETIESGVHSVINLGRGMLEDEQFSDDKEQEYIDRMDDLEKRMNMLKDWPDGDQNRKRISKRCRDFDVRLRRTEIAVSHFEQKAKVTERESVDLQSAKKSFDNIKTLICERDQLELDVSEVLGEGRTILEDEQDMDHIDRSFYTRRMNRLEERVRLLREWLQNEMLRLRNLFIILIKQHLERLLDWLVRAEVKMDLEDDIAANQDDVVKQYNKHMEFHKEVGMYSTVNMILEIDIDDPALDNSLQQDVKTLSERWAAVWTWSEERKDRLLEVIDNWQAFREKEKELYDWLVGKDEAIQMSDMIDISDEDQVEAQSAILKNLVKDIKSLEVQVYNFHDAGEKLIGSAQYHHKTAKPIRDEVKDFKDCWQNELDRAERRAAKLTEARKKFLEMAELKKKVSDWLDSTDKLIQTFDEERNEEEQQKFLNKIEIQLEERDVNLKCLEKINELNQELTPAIEKDSAEDINSVISMLNRRMQDTSDKLDMLKDDHVPLNHEECCLMDYIKRSLWEPGHRGHEIKVQK